MEQHLPDVIRDLAVILTAAGIITVLFKAMRQPVVLGYIIAGVLVGPHVHFLPSILDVSSLKVWAEIGVIFLLFALGLEFSFKRLFRVGGTATITSLVESAAMIAIGFATGRAFGWSTMDSIFLGGILAISSTTIIIRAFEEAGVKERHFAGLVFGILIVEDVVAILLLVLLSTLAISQQFKGVEMASSLVKLGFFLTLWFLSGIFIIPTLLRRFRLFLNEETMLIVSVGLCFMMVILATQAGFSPALGAFIMGSILAETTQAEKIEHLIRPLKDLFAAVFFVSVGTLIDPKAIADNYVAVIVIALITIFGKAIATTAGALLSGQTLRHSVQSGMSLAQIGEFSFIIAGLGLTLGVTSDFLYPIAVGVSAVTTFTTPYMIRSADRVVAWSERYVPARWKQAIDSYSASMQSLSTTSEWRQLFRSYVSRTAVNAVIVTAIMLGIAKTLPMYLIAYVPNAATANGVSLLLALLVSTPFLWAWLLGHPAEQQATELWKTGRNRGPILILEIARFASAFALVGFLASRFVSTRGVVLFLSLWAGVVLIFFSRYWKKLYDWLESRFISNFTERETLKAAQTPAIAPWDAHIATLEVSPDSEVIGKTLMEVGIREKFGVTIALIERGSRVLTAPMRTERLYPFDQLSVIGTDEQITQFKRVVEMQAPPLQQGEPLDTENYSLHQLPVSKASPYCSRTIRDSGIRENTKGLVVGIERAGMRILNPDSAMTIEDGDILWLVGDTRLVRPAE